MVLKKQNHELNFGFLSATADLKKDVFIYLRKQIGQKMEGISASQL